MSGETNTDRLFKSLSAKLVEGLFVFVTVPGAAVPATITPLMMFQEAEGTTLIVAKRDAEALGLEHEFPCRMITLDVHSSLEAVGFIARISAELARHGIPVNPVSGFYHDHLFVPESREEEAMRVLAELAAGNT